jgi:polyferredoxin
MPGRPSTLPRPAGPHARLQRWRWLVQAGFLALTALIAWEFATFFRQATSGGPVTAHRPGGVEAYLPIGALLGIRRWLETGFWDEIHPAGMTFLLAVVGGAVLARRAFCAWICPFGLLFRALEWLRARLRLPARWNAPRWARWSLEAVKYLVLGQIVWMFATMPVEAVDAFMYLPYNLAADANMLLYVATLGATGALVFGGIVLLSTMVRSAWCRFLCPYGALLGVAGAASPLRIVRDEAACAHCGACTRSCGMGIEVERVRQVRSLECTSCMACVSTCPHAALDVRGPRGVRVRPWVVPAIALGVLAAAWLVARAAGFWESSLSVEDFVRAYRTGVRPR